MGRSVKSPAENSSSVGRCGAVSQRAELARVGLDRLGGRAPPAPAPPRTVSPHACSRPEGAFWKRDRLPGFLALEAPQPPSTPSQLRAAPFQGLFFLRLFTKSVHTSCSGSDPLHKHPPRGPAPPGFPSLLGSVASALRTLKKLTRSFQM